MDEENKVSYMRFMLRTKCLTRDVEKYLGQLGVECVDEGGPFEAFGITAQAPKVLRHIQSSGEIIGADTNCPPTGK